MKTDTTKPAANVAKGDVLLGENWFKFWRKVKGDWERLDGVLAGNPQSAYGRSRQ